jgi:hypothetical protein
MTDKPPTLEEVRRAAVDRMATAYQAANNAVYFSDVNRRTLQDVMKALAPWSPADARGARSISHNDAAFMVTVGSANVLKDSLPEPDPLHPNGRCECAGEGECPWCVRTALTQAYELMADLLALCRSDAADDEPASVVTDIEVELLKWEAVINHHKRVSVEEFAKEVSEWLSKVHPDCDDDDLNRLVALSKRVR